MPLTFTLTAYQAGQRAAWVVMALLAVLLVRRFLQRRRTSDAVAALVVAVLLVGGLVRAGGDTGIDTAEAGDSWSSANAADMRAGFLDGCRYSSNGAVNCECFFTQLTSQPQYSTPQGFAGLAKELQATPRRIPPGYTRALDACRRP